MTESLKALMHLSLTIKHVRTGKILGCVCCTVQQPLPLRAVQDILHAAVTQRLQHDAKNG